MSLISTDLQRAVSYLQQGIPVAIPTETVYGLAAPINQKKAIKAIFSLKNRPLNHPLIVHIAPGWDITKLVRNVSNTAKHLMHHFWPGPLTLVFESGEHIEPLITGHQPTIAIRCPDHPLTQELLKKLNTPLVAPSANPFGKVSPTTAQHVQQSFPEEDLFILDGGRCTVGIESTIVDVTAVSGFNILRHGLLDETRLQQASLVESFTEEKRAIQTPGRLAQHYQPETTLFYFSSYEALNQFCQKNLGQVYVIASKKPEGIKEGFFNPLPSTPAGVAYNLYDSLRQGDKSGAQWLAIELPRTGSEWEGIRERIMKAGTYAS